MLTLSHIAHNSNNKVKVKMYIFFYVAIICTIFLCVSATACINMQPDIDQFDAVEKKSNTLDYNMFSLDGVIYTLPVHFTEFMENGWEPYEYSNYILEPDDTKAWKLANGERYVMVMLANFSEYEIPGIEGYVVSVITFPPHTNAEVIIPGNIMLGSTYEDVVAIHGNPHLTMEYDERTHYIFPDKDGVSVDVYVDVKSNLLVFMQISYFGSESYDVERPNLNMFILNGNTYTLPIHFSEFRDKGWEPYEYNDYTLEPNEFDTWTLTRDNQQVMVIITNYSDEPLPGIDCYITSITSLLPHSNADMELYGNIILGSTYDDVINIFGKPDKTEEYNGSQILSYNTVMGEMNNITLDLYIAIGDENEVISISMHYVEWDR